METLWYYLGWGTKGSPDNLEGYPYPTEIPVDEPAINEPVIDEKHFESLRKHHIHRDKLLKQVRSNKLKLRPIPTRYSHPQKKIVYYKRRSRQPLTVESVMIA